MKRLATALSCLLFVACAQSGESASDTGRSDGGTQCDDRDGDGFGEGCSQGGDCDDLDKSIHTGCTRCQYPQQGCGCTAADQPVSCYLTPSEDDEGKIMCHEGTRYCRSGLWSACETVVTYPRTEPVDTVNQGALVSPTATRPTCNDCSVNCYVVRDNLDPTDAGLGGTSANISSSGGGLTLTRTVLDAGAADSGPAFDQSKCILGTKPDRDCDGILDDFDPYPDAKPFATTNPTLFLDIAPGETGTGVVNLQFYLNSADVYFLLDQTSTMAEETANLKNGLTTGDYINNAAYQCADYDFDRQPNNELKAKGIMGAIRCMIRDANFGVGYFREIPFSNYGGSSASPAYPATDSVTFSNVQDITSDITKVTSGVSTLFPLANSDYPEAGSMALNALVSAKGFDFGNDRVGVPARTNCPTGTFGTPCFRNKAIPIVLMFTDDPSHQGPSSYPETYSTLTLTRGQGNTVVDTTHEGPDTAFDLAGVDLVNTFTAYTGTTAGMGSDFTNATSTCTTDGQGPDVAFKFTLPASTSITATTAGTSFDNGLSIVAADPTALDSYPNTNDSASNAYSFGNISNSYVQASGDSSSLKYDYSSLDMGCSSALGSKDAAFTFQVGGTGTTRVSLDTTGSSYTTSVALYSTAPPATSYTTISNTDTMYAMGAAYGNNIGVIADTSSGVTANYVAAQLACSTAPADAAFDASYSFTLSQATKVRISTEGSTVNHDLALSVAPTMAAVPVASGKNTNEDDITAVSVGALDGAVKQYTGSTVGMASNYDGTQLSSCNGAGGKTPDALFKFTLSATRSVTIDTIGSALNTVLSLFKGPTLKSAVSASGTYRTKATALSLSSNLNGTAVPTSNATTKSGGSGYYTSAVIGCGSNSSSPDTVFKFTLSAATSVRLETSGTNFDTVVSLHKAPVPTTGDLSATTFLACANNSTSTTANERIETSTLATTTLAAGDYYVVVKGGTASSLGSFVLTVTDIGITPLACNNDYTALSTKASSITQTALAAGTYYVMVKADSSAATSGTYVLNLQDNATSTCDATGTNSALIDNKSLTAGTYRVIVKGKTASDKGPYRLSVRDLTNVTNPRVNCDHSSGTGGLSSHLESVLNPGTYTVVLKADTTTGAGTYKLAVRDVTNLPVYAGSCNNGSGNTSSLTKTLPKGSYYAVIKGATSSTSGTYQLNIGGKTTFVPPTWDQTVALLQSKAVRVIPVLSCKNSAGVDGPRCAETRTQYSSLASDTGAIGSNLQTLQYDIHDDGTGLSNSVVTGVSELAKYLEMDVSARVVFEPDANPGFGVSVVAVDAPGDGCSGLVNNEHIQCIPGAAPKFNVLFTNPLNAPVMKNKNDPKGGYNFRVELIGDDQFIVDQVPVYIVPYDAAPPPPVPQVASSGTYWQDLNSASCTGNLLPDWHDLTWDSSVPKGTSVTFSVCTSDKTTDLTGCTPTPLCTVTGGDACTSDATCGNGFCSVEHNCLTITGKSCSVDTDCTTGAKCKSSRCTFPGQPVYVGESLGTSNYTANLRMFVGLTGNTTDNTAPTVHTWSLSYVCNSAL